MRENFNVKMFEQWLKTSYSHEILTAPDNSMTPLGVDLPDGRHEFIFLVKAESWLYEPLQGKDINDTVPMGVKSYKEGENLIFGFDVDPDINLESVIPKDKIEKFLTSLRQQDIITVVVIDHITMNIVWLTNNYPFWSVRDKFSPLFDFYGIV